MAEIYRIGSDDLVDRASTFGGTNLAWGSDYSLFGLDTYSTKTNVTILDNKKIKIEAGGSLKREMSNILNFDPPLFIKNLPIIWHFYIFENSLNAQCSCTVYYKSGTSSGAGHSNNIPAGLIGLHSNVYSSYKDNNFYGAYLKLDASSATSGNIIIGPLKVEIGNKPTDWTPALEDLVTYDSSSESLVFFQ